MESSPVDSLKDDIALVRQEINCLMEDLERLRGIVDHLVSAADKVLATQTEQHRGWRRFF